MPCIALTSIFVTSFDVHWTSVMVFSFLVDPSAYSTAHFSHSFASLYTRTHARTHALTRTHFIHAPAHSVIPFIHSVIHLSTKSLSHAFTFLTDWLTLTHSHTHTHTHSLTHSLTHTFTHSHSLSLTHSLTLTHTLIHSLTHSLTLRLTHSLTHSLSDSLTRSIDYSHLLCSFSFLFDWACVVWTKYISFPIPYLVQWTV